MEAHEIAEHIEHHAHDHHAAAHSDGLRKVAGIYLGIVAMLLAIATLGGTAATKELLSANIQASDTYAYYQAKYLRQTIFETAADMLEAGPNAADPKAQALIKRYRGLAAHSESEPKSGNGKKELLAKARAWEERRDTARARDPNFEFAEALLQIAIVLGSVSIVATSRALLGVSAVLAVCGVALTLNGFLLLVPLSHG